MNIFIKLVDIKSVGCSLVVRFFLLILAAMPKGKSQYESLDFQDRFDILLEIRLSGIAEQ